jgi:hypothetical protein
VGAEGRDGTMYAHVNKWISNKKKSPSRFQITTRHDPTAHYPNWVQGFQTHPWLHHHGKVQVRPKEQLDHQHQSMRNYILWLQTLSFEEITCNTIENWHNSQELFPRNFKEKLRWVFLKVWAWWYTSVIPGTWETERGGS